MKNRCFFFLFLWSFSISSFSQSTELKAWLDVARDQQGRVVISGKVLNQSGKSQAYSYALKLEKIANSGNISNTQSGSFTLVKDEEKILSSVTIDFSATSFFKVVLKVFDDEQLLATKVLKSDEQFLKSFQQIPIPKSEKNIVENASAKPKKIKPTNTDALEIGGLIIDETRSKTGRDFYEIFYNKWTPPAAVKDFTIIIRELPARGRVARVSVEVNSNTVIQRMLQPRQEIIELLAEQSVNVVKKHLIDKEKLKDDLGNGDQQGSGIY